MTKETKQHKPGCLANTYCAVYHPSGVCTGLYGKCTCDEIKESLVETKQLECSCEENKGRYTNDNMKKIETKEVVTKL